VRANSILQRVLSPGLVNIHVRRARALLEATNALLFSAKASVTSLGRAMQTTARVKHSIKRVDRLVGNCKLHAELPTILQHVAARLLRQTPEPVVLVDYTDLPQGFVALVAAVASRGRACVVYFEVYDKSQYGNAQQQQRFLERLKAVLPATCRPVIVTDAGFCARWFQQVQQLGWHYVGRVRGQTKFCSSADGHWLQRAELVRDVHARPRDFGRLWLNKERPSRHRVVAVYKKAPRRPTPSRGLRTQQQKCRARAREPWVLATSLTGRADVVVGHYALRMQIEESFRDAKNSRWGFCLKHARCRSQARWSVLLLLCTLASLVTLLVGFASEAQRIHLHYQANSTKHRRVLSLFVLGRHVLSRSDLKLPAATLLAFISRLPCAPGT